MSMFKEIPEPRVGDYVRIFVELDHNMYTDIHPPHMMHRYTGIVVEIQRDSTKDAGLACVLTEVGLEYIELNSSYVVCQKLTGC